MSLAGTRREDLAVGMEVEVNPRNDRTRTKLESGKISEILSSTPFHTHGILVILESGITGRVKNIVGKAADANSDAKYEKVVEKHTTEEIIAGGENHFVEFKSSALWSERLLIEDIKRSGSKDIQKYKREASKVLIAKTIAAFLNTDGGVLLIGVKENKDSRQDEVIGIESEYGKLEDRCSDGYRRKIIDSIIGPYFPKSIFNHFNSYIQIEFDNFNGKVLCRIDIEKSDQKVFLKIMNIDSFFIRVDASTRQLIGEEIIDYCFKRFA